MFEGAWEVVRSIKSIGNGADRLSLEAVRRVGDREVREIPSYTRAVCILGTVPYLENLESTKFTTLFPSDKCPTSG